MNYEIILKNLRKQIDTIDADLLDLFAKRFQVSEAIGEVKKENNLPTLNEERWQELLWVLKKKASLNWLDETFVEDVWNRVHIESLSRQK